MGGNFDAPSSMILLEPTATQDLSVGAMSFTTSLAVNFNLISIHFHATAAFTQTITVTLDCGLGASHDTVIAKKTTASTIDVLLSCYGLYYKIGDEIKVEVTNSGTPSTTVNMKLIAELR